MLAWGSPARGRSAFAAWLSLAIGYEGSAWASPGADAYAAGGVAAWLQLEALLVAGALGASLFVLLRRRRARICLAVGLFDALGAVVTLMAAIELGGVLYLPPVLLAGLAVACFRRARPSGGPGRT